MSQPCTSQCIVYPRGTSASVTPNRLCTFRNATKYMKMADVQSKHESEIKVSLFLSKKDNTTRECMGSPYVREKGIASGIKSE